MPQNNRPDALFLPLSLKVGATIFERVRAIAAVAEPLLECDRSAGERAYIRQQPNVLFVTRGPYDTIFFATTHHRAGQPRYRWEKRPGGIEVGYLVEGAELDRRENISQANV